MSVDEGNRGASSWARQNSPLNFSHGPLLFEQYFEPMAYYHLAKLV
jgi:hypothetical protein